MKKLIALAGGLTVREQWNIAISTISAQSYRSYRSYRYLPCSTEKTGRENQR